jgi:glycosyltransferase involved in cell wall biosynthesis
MRKFHICNTRSRSGIARYAEAFFRVALRDVGYVHLEPDQVDEEMARSDPASGAVWHVQLGAHQFQERDAFVKLLRAGHRNVDATLHDPPFLTFPFFHFDSPIANRVSRGVDWYLDTLGWQSHYARKARRIFVLSEKGAAWLRARRGVSTVEVMPHVVEASSIWNDGPGEDVRDVIFFGYIGRTKGLDYALELHSAIRGAFPEVGMHIVGQPGSRREQRDLDELLRRFDRGVEFHGFLPEEKLDAVFARCEHVFLPFARYKYFCPVSGSTLNGLKRGRIVWTSDVNAVGELIDTGVNGLLFSGSVEQDLTTYRELRANPDRRAAISSGALETVRAMSGFDYSRHFRED